MNETTTDPALIAGNGNDPKLYDDTVFTWVAGAPVVTIRYTKAQMIAMANNATGANLTSIVDTAGLTADPMNSGEILFTTGSTSQTLGGKVFTSANGGTIASLNGVLMDGQSQWGLKSRPVIDALTRMQAGKDPMTLSLDSYRVVTPAPASANLSVDGAIAGGTVQLFVSYANLPHPTPWKLRPPLGAVGYAYLTQGDPLFYNSTNVGPFTIAIDQTGHGRFRLGVGHIPAGVTFVMQGVDLSNYEVSEPVALSLVTS